MDIKITRGKLYPTPGTNYRFAWKWLYTVHYPGGSASGSKSEVLWIANKKAKETGLLIHDLTKS